MESQNKVMTVSYGTFSCTLDGFDDPFTTMQLVAEYFRKLASEDRYFGGEPLQPDTNTLHRIAQDANPYKVDAEVTDTGVTLRKADVVDAPVAKDNAPAPQPAPIEPVAKEVAEEAAAPAPLFSSRRVVTPVEPVDRAEVEDDADGYAGIEEEDTSLIEPATFSSRRGELDAGEDEPVQSAAELIAQEDDMHDLDDAPKMDVVETASKVQSEPAVVAQDDTPEAEAAEGQAADLQAIKEQITSEVKSAKREKFKEENDIQLEEAALERLLETTNTKMDNPAHTRKSNALERLKAAVAATEAERRLRSEPSKTARPKVQDLSDPAEFKSRMGEVRRNHEEVVKMTRPKAKKTGDRARGAFATLILGNDQRVGSNDAAEAAASVKKRAADGQQTAEPSKDRAKPALKIVRPTDEEDGDLRGVVQTIAAPQGFAAFAEKIGASSLLDLLEASAAYLCLVEDEPRFSQTRILENLDDFMAQNNVSPEAANRSLNRLMRDGRILRIKKDSYTISKSARHGYQNRLVG